MGIGKAMLIDTISNNTLSEGFEREFFNFCFKSRNSTRTIDHARVSPSLLSLLSLER
jgi:hypothetical protein